MEHNFFFCYFSVDPENGHFLTADPLYSPETFAESKPEFKKTVPKKKVTKDETTEQTTPDTPEIDSFISKIQKVDLSELRIKNLEAYRQVLEDTLSLCEEEIINPYVSRVFSLNAINEAVEFVANKSCTGKVLIDLRSRDDSESSDDEAGDETTKSKGK